MQHVLIDYENIQPNSLTGIDTQTGHVWLFLGPHQNKLPLSLVESLLQFHSENVHIIKVDRAGKNALDFYLSFYLGQILALNSQADIYIVSCDSGYNLLIDHINQNYKEIVMSKSDKDTNIVDEEKLLNEEAVEQLSKKDKKDKDKKDKDKKDKDKKDKDKKDKDKKDKKQKEAKKVAKKEVKKQYHKGIKLLKKQPANKRPIKKKALRNFLLSQLRTDDEQLVERVIERMIKKKRIKISINNKVSYRKKLKS